MGGFARVHACVRSCVRAHVSEHSAGCLSSTRVGIKQVLQHEQRVAQDAAEHTEALLEETRLVVADVMVRTRRLLDKRLAQDRCRGLVWE
jgi:hypothetical protein